MVPIEATLSVCEECAAHQPREQPLREYASAHGIRWQPIAMKVWQEGGETKKRFLQEHDPGGLRWTPKTTDFQVQGQAYKGGKCEGQGVGDAELQRRRARVSGSEFIAVDTWGVPQLDVDDEAALEEPLLQQLMQSAPYFLSSTKKMPHFFVSVPREERHLFGQTTGASVFGTRTLEAGANKKEPAKVELLWGTWSFARADAVVFNAHLPPPQLRAEQLIAQASKKRKATQAVPAAGRTREVPVEGEGPCLPMAPEAQFWQLMGLMGFPMERYEKMVQAPVSLASFAQYGTVERFIKARPPRGLACHMCGDQHTDTTVGTVTLQPDRADEYRLTAKHFSLKRNPRCKRVYSISAEAAAALQRRLEQQPRLGAPEVAALRTACERAGAHLKLSRVWRLEDPAPGFEAHASKEQDGRWRLLLRPGASGKGGMWHRFTLYPGLHYEYLLERAWVSLGQPRRKPDFWKGA